MLTIKRQIKSLNDKLTSSTNNKPSNSKDDMITTSADTSFNMAIQHQLKFQEQLYQNLLYNYNQLGYDAVAHPKYLKQQQALIPKKVVQPSNLVEKNVATAIPVKAQELGDFQIERVLGSGNFGKVMLCRYTRQNQVYAVKSILKSKVIEDDQLAQIEVERKIIAKVDHPFIINLDHSFQTKTNLYFVMEYLPGGELYHYLRNQPNFRISEQQAKFYISEIILAIGYLHYNNVIFRDLKPENVVINTDGHIKLVDFGLAKISDAKIENKQCKTLCGTPAYIAPEVITHAKTESGYGHTIDIWALGVLFYEMLVGDVPFEGYEPVELYTAIATNPVIIPTDVASSLSTEAADLIHQLLTKDECERIGCRDYDTLKCHPFFSDVNFIQLFKKQIKPSYIPKLSSPHDTKHFSTDFTDEKPVDRIGSVVSDSESSGFENFDFSASELRPGK